MKKILGALVAALVTVGNIGASQGFISELATKVQNNSNRTISAAWASATSRASEEGKKAIDADFKDIRAKNH